MQRKNVIRHGRLWLGATAVSLATMVASVDAVSAQTPTRTITFDDAIEIALEQNIDVLRARNATALQASAVTRQWMQFLPSLSLSVQGGSSVGRAFSEDVGAIVNETTSSLNAGVSTSVTLFDGFRNVAQLESAQLSESAAGSDLERTRQTVLMTVATNFVAIIEGDEQVRVRREALAAQQAELEQIEAFVEAGARPVADLYQQQANMAAMQSALVNAGRASELARLDLIATLQLDPAAEYDFLAPEIPAEYATPDDRSLDALIARALERRPDFDAAQARASAAGQNVRAASGSWWPSVSLGASYNTGATSASEFGFEEQLDQRRGGSLSLGVSIPLFDRLTTSSAVEEARIQEENAGLEVQRERQTIALEVRRAVLDRDAAIAQLRAADAQLVAAQRALEAMSERYRVGAATLVEVTQARASQVEAASALVSARHALVLAATLLDYYTGDLIAEDVVFADA